jgi:hypothetical protein
VTAPATRIAVVLLALLAAGCGSASTAAAPGTTAATPTATASTAAPATPAAAPVVTPTAVTIPAIGVRSPLVALHLDATGALVPPASYAVAGWYTGGPTPGDPGPAVIAGHIDSTSGPGVFYRLRDLRAGDEVDVDRSDGVLARFTVDAVREYPKGQFPTDAVYGPAPGVSLRLITCGGTFDYAVHSYRDNVVVFATGS